MWSVEKRFQVRSQLFSEGDLLVSLQMREAGDVPETERRAAAAFEALGHFELRRQIVESQLLVLLDVARRNHVELRRKSRFCLLPNTVQSVLSVAHTTVLRFRRYQSVHLALWKLDHQVRIAGVIQIHGPLEILSWDVRLRADLHSMYLYLNYL